jgi:hypothetical protein
MSPSVLRSPKLYSGNRTSLLVIVDLHLIVQVLLIIVCLLGKFDQFRGGKTLLTRYVDDLDFGPALKNVSFNSKIGSDEVKRCTA